MISPWWSILLTAVGILGLWLAGNHRWQGWAVSLASEVLWVAYAVATEQWGFIAMALIYAAAHTRNLRRWRREARLVELDNDSHSPSPWSLR